MRRLEQGLNVTDSKHRLLRAGIEVETAHGSLPRWALTNSHPRALNRIRRFIRRILTANLGSAGVLPARMVALDAIPPKALRQIEAQQCIPYVMQGEVAIHWEEANPPRTERRLLSPMTLDIWPRAPAVEIQEHAPLVNLSSSLEAFLKGDPDYGVFPDPMGQLDADALAWCQQALPAVLFAHCAELTVMSALSPSAWARRESGAVPVLTTEGPSEDLDQGVTGELVDSAFESNGGDAGHSKLKIVLDILSENPSVVDGQVKRHWLMKLRAFAPSAMTAGPITALITGWVAHMCEAGTVGEANPAASTIRKYANRAVLPLFLALRALGDDLESAQWSTDHLKRTYLDLINAESAGNQQTMRAALVNFHQFLATWIDIEPLRNALDGSTSIARVNANVVWPHEVQRTMRWARETGDEQMGANARLIIGIASEAPARASELSRIRLRNVQFSEDASGTFAEIEIARDAHNGRLKTKSSPRRLYIRCAQTLALLSAKFSSRRSEGAVMTAFLFGERGDDEQRYRPAATLAYINRLLKNATGDDNISLHTLRHTCLSRSAAEAFASSATSDIVPLECIAASAGHASPLTTLRSYSHQYEHAMRLWLNISLARAFELQSDTAAKLLHIKPATLRQRAFRAGATTSGYAWRALLMFDGPPIARKLVDYFDWREPCAPKESTSNKGGELTVGIVAAAVEWLLAGKSSDLVGNRFGIDPEHVDRLRKELVAYCCARAQILHPLRNRQMANPRLLTLSEAAQYLDLDYERRKQSKYAALVAHLETAVADAELRKAAQAFEDCQRGEYLSLEEPQAIGALLRLFKSAQVPSRALVMMVETKDVVPLPDGNLVPHIAKDVVAVRFVDSFKASFVIAPRIYACSPWSNRPRLYLSWDSGSGDTKPDSAASSIAGLAALMFAVRAYLILKSLDA